MEGRLQPVLLGGLFIAVLSALPLVQMGNCCCCLWVVAGGAIAAYLRQKELPTPIAAAEGLLIGLLAGLIGGIGATLLSIPIDMAMGPFQRRVIEWLANNPSVPPELRDAIQSSPVEPIGAGAIAFQFVAFTFAGTVFGLLGGLLGAVTFKKTPPPPPPGTVEILPPQM